MSDRHWTEDECRGAAACKACHVVFVGHHRRTLCKECDKGDSQGPVVEVKPRLGAMSSVELNVRLHKASKRIAEFEFWARADTAYREQYTERSMKLEARIVELKEMLLQASEMLVNCPNTEAKIQKVLDNE